MIILTIGREIRTLVGLHPNGFQDRHHACFWYAELEQGAILLVESHCAKLICVTRKINVENQTIFCTEK